MGCNCVLLVAITVRIYLEMGFVYFAANHQTHRCSELLVGLLKQKKIVSVLRGVNGQNRTKRMVACCFTLCGLF